MDDSVGGPRRDDLPWIDATLDDERRALVGLWHRRRAERRWPVRADFDIPDFRDVIGRVALVDVDRSGAAGDPVLRYRLFGTWLVHEIGTDLTGQTVDALERDWQREMVWRIYCRVLEAGRPVAAIRRQIGAERSMGHALVALPLGAERVDMILTVYGLIPSTPVGWRGPWQDSESYELHQWVFDLGDDGTPGAVPVSHDGVALGAEDVPRRSSPVPGASGLPACRVTVRDSRRL